MNRTAKIFTLISLIWLAGCENSLVVKGNFPAPMIDKLPHTLGVYYEPEFSEYIYKEKSEDRSMWTITAGPAQVDVLSKVLPKMFTSVIPVNALPSPENPSQAELIFSPRIDEFQYALPRETKVNVFEIWIKYNMRIYNAAGQLLADWLMTAYGKTPTAFMTSKEEAVNEAAVMALRDMGATLSLRLPEVPEIKAWLVDHKPNPLSDPNAPLTQDPDAPPASASLSKALTGTHSEEGF